MGLLRLRDGHGGSGPHLAELIARLNDLPEGQKGEIIDGELFVQPRPRFRRGWRRERMPAPPPEGEPPVALEPFGAAELPLGRLWLEQPAR